MAPVHSIPITSSYSKKELELLNQCKDYISAGSKIDCSKLGDKPFCHSSLDTRRLIIDDIAVHYNTKILDKTVCGCHLVRGNKDTEGIVRWKCSNYLNKCHAAIWINKKGELHDTTSTHKECCKASDDANNKTLQMNGFIQTNRDAYERSVYHLQCIKSIVRHVSSDNLYTYFVTYMRDIEKLEVNSMWRNCLSHKLWYDVDKLVHSGVKRLDQTQALVTYLESNSEHYIKFEGKDDSGTLTHISWIDVRFDHFKRKEKKIVFSKDVTFGVVDCNSGFDKLSTISALNADHTVDPLCFTLVVKETKECFTEEMEFFCHHYSWLNLKDSRSTWFVDGDKKNIIAVEKVLPLATVTLCLYHLAGTMYTHKLQCIVYMYIVYSCHTMYTYVVHCMT